MLISIQGRAQTFQFNCNVGDYECFSFSTEGNGEINLTYPSCGASSFCVKSEAKASEGWYIKEIISYNGVSSSTLEVNSLSFTETYAPCEFQEGLVNLKFVFSESPETINGDWSPEWTHQREDFEQTRNHYDKTTGDFVFNEKRNFTVRKRYRHLFSIIHGNFSVYTVPEGYVGAMVKSIWETHEGLEGPTRLSRLYHDLFSWVKREDQGTSMLSDDFWVSDWLPYASNQTEDFEQSRYSWSDAESPQGEWTTQWSDWTYEKESHDNAEFPVDKIETKNIYFFVRYKQLFPHSDPYVNSYVVYSDFEVDCETVEDYLIYNPDGSYINEPPGYLQYYVHQSFGSIEEVDSWEGAVGLDINEDGDMIDLLYRRKFTGEDGDIFEEGFGWECAPNEYSWFLKENRD